MEEKKKTGYCTITYKTRLYINHVDFLKQTKDLYNEVILIYYKLLLENQEFLNLSNQYALRELEKLTIISRAGVKPEKFIDLDLPVYFRRAAINQAIGAVRNYFALYTRFKKAQEIKKEEKQEIVSNKTDFKKTTQKKISKIKEPSITEKFNVSITFYKGMYRNFDGTSLELKLWNGTNWNWYKGKIKNLNLNNDFEILSPTVVIGKKFVMLHLPIRQSVEDVRTVKERMQDEDLKVMGISFSNNDNFAICTVLDKDRNFIKSKFLKGGNDYKAKTTKILNLIKNHRQKTKVLQEKDHKKYWEKLNNIDNYTAHKASREIIDFAKENNVKVISIANVQEDVNTFVQKVGKHSPIYLRRKIISNLEYKAFKEGILVTTVRQNYTASKCYKCRGKVKKSGENMVCENGHTGNYYFNSAMNISIMALKKFGK